MQAATTTPPVLAITRRTYFTALTYFVWNFPILKNIFGDSSTGQRFFFAFILCLTGMSLIFSSKRLERSTLSFVTAFFVALCYYSVSMVLTIESLVNILEGWGRTVVYLCGFLIGVLTARNLEPAHYLRIMVQVFYINVVFCLLPFIPGGSFVVDFWKGRLSDDPLAALHYFRWTGTFAYPTDFGFYLTLVMLMAHFHRERLSRREYMIINGLALLSTLLSVSRIAFGALAIVLPLLYRRHAIKLAVGAALLIAAVLPLLPEKQLEYIQTGFAVSGKLDDSARHRMVELSMATSPDHLSLLGHGPKDERVYAMITIIEGWMPYQLLTWGVVGLTFAILFFGLLFILSWPALKTRDPWMLTFWSATIVALVLYGPFSAVIDRFKMPYLLFSLLGAASVWSAREE